MNWNNTNIHDLSNTTVVRNTTFNDPPVESPSLAIAMALAALEEKPPSQTTFTLADEVDPDALNDLVTTETNDVGVTFTIDDYLIVAQSNGRVQIRTVKE